jgi:hypothetical protein
MAGTGATQPADAGTPAALLDDDDPALFPKLSDSQLDLLASHAHVRAITTGDVLFRYGTATRREAHLAAGPASPGSVRH